MNSSRLLHLLLLLQLELCISHSTQKVISCYVLLGSWAGAPSAADLAGLM